MAHLDTQPWDGDLYPALYRDLALHPERVAPFFPLDPSSDLAWRTRARQITERWAGLGERRSQLCRALTGIAETLGPTAAQRENLERLASPDALVVVTGQQAGLLTGPLFTIYKALGTLARARAASKLLGVPVIPVFWVASEDHDFSEISKVSVQGHRGERLDFVLPGRSDGRSAGRIPVPAAAGRLVTSLLESQQPLGSGGDAVADALGAQLARRPMPASLAEWFTRQMHALLGEQGLLFYDPMWPALRHLAVPVFSAAADRAPEVNRVVNQAAQDLRAAGYAPGLDFEEGQVHLFVYRDGRRVAMHLRDGMLCTRDGEELFDAAALPEQVRRDPENFSPDVALRPVVQDWTLPVLAQLGGPGEIAYLAQLEGVFRLWEVSRPIIVPRPGATIILPEDAAILKETEIPLPRLRTEAIAALDAWLGRHGAIDIEATFAGKRKAIEQLYGELADHLGQVASTLPPLVEGNRERVLYQIGYLERKAKQHRRRAAHDISGQVRATSSRLFPGGGLQERVSNIYGYLLREGPEFLRALTVGLPADGLHHLVYWQR